MAITFVASGTFVSGTSTVSPGLPSGWAADDLHVLVVESYGSDGDPGTISGWTRVNGVYNTGGGTDRAGVTVYIRKAVGGDSGPTVPDSGNHTSARIHGFRGVDTTTAQDATAVTTENNSNSTSLSVTGITTNTDGAMVVYCVGHGDDAATWSSLAGHNLASITDVADSHTAGNDGTNHAAYGLMTTAGASGTLTGTIAVSEHTAAVTIALKPAAPDTEDDLLADNVESDSEVTKPAITQEHGILADDVQSVSEVSAGVLGGEHTLLADNVESVSELTKPAVNEVVPLLADDVQSVSEVDAGVLGQTHVVLADDVQSVSELSSPAVGQEHAILADDVQSTSEVAAGVLGGEHTLLADDVQSVSELSKPAVAESNVLLADDVESASQVSSPAVGQVHAVLADDAESASELTKPAVGQVHAVLADDVESVSELSKPAATHIHDLLADDVESVSQLSKPTLAEAAGTDNLLANDVQSLSEVSSSAVGQVHAILADNLESLSNLSSPAVGQDQSLLAENVQSLSELLAPTLDRPVVVVEEPTYRGSFSYRPDDKDIEELLKVLDGPKPKKRNAKRKKIIRLEKAAIKILSEGISNPIEPAIIETLKRTDFAIKLLEAKPERRQEQAEELLQQASVLVQEIDKEEEDLLELLLLAA